MTNTASVRVNAPEGAFNVTFHQGRGIGVPANAIKANGATEKIEQVQAKLLQYEADIHRWVAASEKNALLFLQNPIQAIESANLGIPAELLAELKAVSDSLVNTLKK